MHTPGAEVCLPHPGENTKEESTQGKGWGGETALRALRAVEGNVLEILSKVQGEAKGSAEQG